MKLMLCVWGRWGLAVGATILMGSAAAPNPQTFESFADFCTNKANLTPETRHTVEVLLSKAKTQECDRAQKTLSNLTELSLIRNQIVDIKPLSKFTNLRKLNLSLNQITDVQPLSGLTNLRFLTLNFNQISDVKPLSGLTNLTDLFLEANQIVDVKPLAGLTNLTGLSLASNQIVDVTPLSRMTELNFLYLSDNKIADVKPLSGLTNLILLFLASNQITDVKPLGGLTNLTALDISRNQIADIKPLAGLVNLTNLDLSRNPIPDGEADRLIQKNKQLLNQKTDEAERLMQEARRLFTQETAASYQEALQKFDAARSLYQMLRNREKEAYTLHQMGFITNRLGDRQQALNYYKQALSWNRTLADRPKQVVILNNIGAVYYALGEKQQAIDYYNQVLSLIREMGDRPEASINLSNISNLPANSDTSLGDRTAEATTLNNIGLAYKDLGEKQKAKEYFNQALPLFRAMGDRAKEATTLTNIGLVYSDLGEKQQALDYYKQALDLRQKAGDRRGEALTLNNTGTIYSELGKPQKAEEYFNQALSLFRAVGDRPGEALTLYNMANIKGDRGNLIAALTDIETSIKIIENLRTKITNDELRISYFATVQDYYQFYIHLLMELHKTNPKSGYDRKALEASESSRARSLLELLQEANADIRQGVAPELLQRERNLQQQLDALETRRIETISRPNSTPAEKAELDQKRQTLLGEYQDIQAQIRSTSPRYAALTQPQPLTLAQIQQQILDENTILLQYSLGKERSYLWAVTKTSISSYELPKQADIEKATRNFRYAVTNQRYRNIPYLIAEANNTLSQIILQPVAAQLGQKRLLIVGDGILNYLPFAALSLPETPGKNRNPPLIVNHEIVLLPSASTLGILRQNYNDRQPPTRTLAMLADPVFSADDERVRTQSNSANPQAIESVNLGLSRSSRNNNIQLSRLKFTRQEAQIIQALVPANSRTESLDFAASRATATSQNLSQYKIIHFATHGLANSTNPELSGIILSLVDEKGNPLNGFLRLTDIFNLKLSADLVVLSACQTGLGQNIQGEGMVGLTRGFMYAGAQRVVVSLWSVDDEGTAILMSSFYQGMLQKGLTPAAALRAAQLEMLKQEKWRSPYYWAAFTLQGEWR
ncbi:CHAT domain-containing protein [Kamptonema animale CS-326]|jgi:CHAT domain-containing protein/tetratricopeptide (TPR) repeat protein|uniref:CHAT domain-containing protein n=1 Tax=Kamptonema animale TaxID=92934 RepID=UPI002330FAB8|nr:CHAT domain-containing protein [Kamptonema animale]MDB9513041.1 CHAT domain-containing protein [Kamptonema animale CS-326]